ncbi:hypothetical protein L1987_05132 [Smallanthus sonchifolius]|uniref:Uncharacterized protein n=1 Tax=Smallanthus sonchifolius TaxID=185202 RepID=A0ACB9JUG6_9ASTR|nr:hypothetical protein L1987_05132 [Smallanthus sonchifolius]
MILVLVDEAEGDMQMPLLARTLSFLFSFRYFIPGELKSNLASVTLLKSLRGRVAAHPLRFTDLVTGL